MSDRSKRISDLLKSHKSRTAYIKAKLGVLVPAQIRSLRLKSADPPMPYQRDLAREADLHQSRISMFETPGAANITIETLAKVAAALGVGVIIKFVPFSAMLRWENSFSPDDDVTRLPNDTAFLQGESITVQFPSQETVNLVQELSVVGNAMKASWGNFEPRQGSLPATPVFIGASSNVIGGAA